MSGGCLHPGGLALTNRAARLARLAPGMAVLDIGCGAGASLRLLARKYGVLPYGVDLSEEAAPGVAKTVGDAMSLPYGNGRFDAALCECVLSVLPAAARALREARRVLRPGGVFIVSDVSVCPDESKAALAGAGFETVLFEEHPAALVTYAAELREAGLDARALCGGAVPSTYYLAICRRG